MRRRSTFRGLTSEVHWGSRGLGRRWIGDHVQFLWRQLLDRCSRVTVGARVARGCKTGPRPRHGTSRVKSRGTKAASVQEIDGRDIQLRHVVEFRGCKKPTVWRFARSGWGEGVSSWGLADSRDASGPRIDPSSASGRRGGGGHPDYRRDVRRPGETPGARGRRFGWGCRGWVRRASMPVRSEWIPNAKAPSQCQPSSCPTAEARFA